MNFDEVPEILKGASLEVERPWSLKRMGELLKVAYSLLNHPIFRELYGFEAIDPFFDAMDDMEVFKYFNRTIVERTIDQTSILSQVKLDDGIITIKSKGIEFTILNLESFLLNAKKLYPEVEAQANLEARTHAFRLISSGEIVAAIKYIMEVCNDLFILIKKHFIQNQLKKIEKEEEKLKYLLRAKTNMLQQADQYTERVNEQVLAFIQIEIDHYKEIQGVFDVPIEIKKILEQFLTEKSSRISNNKLLTFLLEENMEQFCSSLKELVMQLFSYHDVGGTDAEKVYHSFLLGVLNSFKEDYHIESNKEAGRGRFDIILYPNSLEYKGLVIEVKRLTTNDQKTIQNVLESALNQIVSNNYAIELSKLGHKQYIGLAAAFYGKDLYLKYQVFDIA